MRKYISKNEITDKMGILKQTLQSWISQKYIEVNEDNEIEIKSLRQFLKIRGLSTDFLIEKAKILVIDDDAPFRMFIEDVLLDYELKLASNGTEGLLVAESFDPDLILLDIRMPSINGLEFLHMIRQKKSLEKTPIIVCSAQLNEGIYPILEAYNVVKALEKPIRLTTLIDEVEQIC